MDVVGVMAAYFPVVRVCTALSRQCSALMHDTNMKISLCSSSSMQSFFILIFVFSYIDVNGVKHSANLILLLIFC